MGSDVEARSQYGGLLLTCDEDTFARIRGQILAEPSVVAAIGGSRDCLDPRFISVRMPPIEDASRGPGWLALVPTLIAGGVSGMAMIVGYLTIVRWLMRWIA